MKRIFIAVFLLFALFPLAADGYQIVEINLQNIVADSDIAFRGKCESREVKTIYPAGAPKGIIVTRYVFTVTETLKGTVPSYIDVYGTSRQEAQKKGTPYAVGFTQFESGKEYVVFMTRTPLGIYAPMGMAQGVFDVKYSPEGKAMLVNKFSNASLYRGLSKSAAGAKAMKAGNIDPKGASQAPIDYGDFKKMVDALK